MPLPTTLPPHWYFDRQHFDKELRQIWRRNWICIGHQREWPQPLDYRVVPVAGLSLVVLRNADGDFRAFYNTCRHRGSRLCEADTGKLTAGRLVCPYHAWSYSADGSLLKAPGSEQLDTFDTAEFSLLPVQVDSWAGYVFVNLDHRSDITLAQALGSEADAVAAWPLDQLALAHREAHDVACNWKIFWENFSECYHCPGVHPELCKLVPAYGRGVMSEGDQPAKLRDGARTWSASGHTHLPELPGLSDQQRQAGMTFATLWPTQFLVAHIDYVRSVRVEPLAAERTRLTVDWLVMPDTLQCGDLDLELLTQFGRQVVMQDARVCALNQQGLHAPTFTGGVLMPNESDVGLFDDWVRRQLS